MRALAEAGIEERVRFHNLRHTFATMALSIGVDVKRPCPACWAITAPDLPSTPIRTSMHIPNDMQKGAAEKTDVFMETATAKPELEPPDPPDENRCKVIPFERVGVKQKMPKGENTSLGHPYLLLRKGLSFFTRRQIIYFSIFGNHLHIFKVEI